MSNYSSVNNSFRGRTSFISNNADLGTFGQAISKSNIAAAGISSAGGILSSFIGGALQLGAKRLEMHTAKQMPVIQTQQYKDRFLFHENKALNAGVPAALFHGVNTPGRLQIIGQGVSYGTSQNHLPVPHNGNALMLNMGQGYY